MIFMALENHEDYVNSSSSDNFQEAFDELYLDLENFGFKNVSLKKIILYFENIEKTKIPFEKENEELKILKWPKDF